MRHALSSILLFLVVASLALACEAVTHANDYGTGTQQIDNCADGTLLCNGACVPEDSKNCGQCNVTCESTQVCSVGVCGSSCSGGTTQCPSADGTNVCVDTQNDPTNCGRCGGPVDAGATCPICQDGLCRSTCLGGKFCPKEKKCVDTDSEPNNCGDCGHVCAAGEFCSGGNCTGSCGSNQTACLQSCVDIQTDPNNCNGCNRICANPGENGVAVCVAGQCKAACNSGFTVCAAAGATGGNGGPGGPIDTCVDVQSDPLNCGRCGNPCALCHQGTCPVQ